jgi:hypothetical protein
VWIAEEPPRKRLLGRRRLAGRRRPQEDEAQHAHRRNRQRNHVGRLTPSGCERNRQHRQQEVRGALPERAAHAPERRLAEAALVRRKPARHAARDRHVRGGTRHAGGGPPEEQRPLGLTGGKPDHRPRGEQDADSRGKAAAEFVGRNSPRHLTERIRVEEHRAEQAERAAVELEVGLHEALDARVILPREVARGVREDAEEENDPAVGRHVYSFLIRLIPRTPRSR